jgi:hypothetical protein
MPSLTSFFMFDSCQSSSTTLPLASLVTCLGKPLRKLVGSLPRQQSSTDSLMRPSPTHSPGDNCKTLSHLMMQKLECRKVISHSLVRHHVWNDRAVGILLLVVQENTVGGLLLCCLVFFSAGDWSQGLLGKHSPLSPPQSHINILNVIPVFLGNCTFTDV